MRSGSTKTGGGFAPIAGARQIASLVRGMSIEAIEESIRQPPQVLFVSSDPQAEEIVGNLTGVRGTPSIQVTTVNNLPRDLEQFDLIIVNNELSNDDFVRVRGLAGRASHLVFDTGPIIDKDALADLRARISEGIGDMVVSLGRWYPAFRHAASTAVINDTSRTNAQFALIANVPAVLPVIGNMIAAGADMLVLTKNQLTMALKISAIYGKPLGNRIDVARDLTPVIGVGFLWRTMAREGAALLPLAAGAIPKVAIAYSGTYATGRAIDAYYRYGTEPNKEQLLSYYQRGLIKVRNRFRPPALPATSEVDYAPPG